ncbi:MAG: TIGR01906 family membrane protein [Anaerolineales bacterium]|nr:TIGR01906 family membrane protein [Anaerolineales bacterium]
MKKILRLFLIASFPLLLFLGWVRIMLFPAFVELEYRRPGFPADPYGFTAEERIQWANISRAYLLSDAGDEFFAQYRLADGSPLYNEREVRHMADVHRIVQTAMVLLAALGILYLAGCAFLFWKDRGLLRRTLATAGLGTFGFLILVLVTVALAWDWAFVGFHRVFFTGETWLFPYSDTLIRLFPVAFWQDGFATAVTGMLVTCLLVWFGAAILPRLSQRKPPAAD